MQKQVYEYISQQTNDPIVEWKICPVSKTEFAVFQSDLEFYDKISPVFNGKKYQIPTPTLCPEERERRRLMFRNERKFYRGKCEFTGKSIISMYPIKTKYKIYDRDIWYSDKRDAMEYQKDFDFSKTFFENFQELNLEVPKASLHIISNMENCAYCNYGMFSKNLYLCIGGGWAEDCYYTQIPARSSYEIDGICNISCQYMYQSVHCSNCFKCFYCDHSNLCKNSYFLSFCNNSEDCIGCVNLNNSKYCILNEQFSKEEYEQKIKEITKDKKSISDFKKIFQDFLKSNKKISSSNIQTENSFGNYIFNSKNIILGYYVVEASDCKYISYGGIGSNDVMDGRAFSNSNQCLEIIGCTANKSLFILRGSMGNNECIYCQDCTTCENCFGCIGLKHKKYCILNKQYSKEEYEKLVPKIIQKMESDGERGEFFSINISPFAYNETIAQEYYPLTKQQVLDRGYSREDEEHFVNIPENMGKINGKDLPNNIKDVTDKIINKIIICEKSNKPYRIIKPELEFYRKENIPLPNTHHDIRYIENLKKRMPKEFHTITCSKCNQKTLSVYKENIESKIRCEFCYNKEIYG